MLNSCKYLAFIALLALFLGHPTQGKEGYGPGDQDWGWINVRRGANMFYWLYYTTAKVNSYRDRPLVIWLQGGPGASSTGYGNFAEIGTLHVNGSLRQHAWTKEVNVLYIDNPVGSGFSYVDNLSSLAKNNIEIGADIVTFLTEFYKRYSSFKKSPMYIFSESYGGKMAVEIGKQLDEKISTGKLDFVFKGVVLVDSWICPIDSVLGWSPLLLSTGVIDERSHKRLMEGAYKIKKAIENGQYEKATSMWGSLEMDIIRETNGVDFYNILYKVPATPVLLNTLENETFYSDDTNFDELHDISKIMNGPVRKVLKIPANIVHGGQSRAVFNALAEDFMKPVMHVVSHLLDKTQLEVVVISGQLDLIVDTYGTLHWVDNLQWNGKSLWDAAPRKPLLMNNVIEGYVTKAKRLTFYWVNRAGHMVPKDSPEVAMELLRRITNFDGSNA